MQKVTQNKNTNLFFIIMAVAAVFAVIIAAGNRKTRSSQQATDAVKELKQEDFDKDKSEDFDRDDIELPSNVEEELDDLEDSINSLNSEDFNPEDLDR